MTKLYNKVDKLYTLKKHKIKQNEEKQIIINNI